MKKYYISADIEGCTGVTSWDETEKGKDGYEEARLQMTKEVAAACEAILESGSVAVVRDGHNDAQNIIHRMLPKGTMLIKGWDCSAGSMMAQIDNSFAGALYIGYHAPAGTNGSPLAHTSEYEKLNYIKINGVLASEFTYNRMYATQFGVPSIFISGDGCICNMAKDEVSDIVIAPVKTCKGNATFNIHPEDACDLIYSKVREALDKDIKIVKLPDRIDMEMCFKTHQALTKASQIPRARIININTVAFSVNNPTEMNIIRERAMD